MGSPLLHKPIGKRGEALKVFKYMNQCDGIGVNLRFILKWS